MRVANAVLVAGGADGAGNAIDATETFDPKTRKWRAAERLETARSHAALASLPGCSAFIAGGMTANGPSATAERYRRRCGVVVPPSEPASSRSRLRAVTRRASPRPGHRS